VAERENGGAASRDVIDVDIVAGWVFVGSVHVLECTRADVLLSSDALGAFVLYLYCCCSACC
jgi:hypothetical protein